MCYSHYISFCQGKPGQKYGSPKLPTLHTLHTHVINSYPEPLVLLGLLLLLIQCINLRQSVLTFKLFVIFL